MRKIFGGHKTMDIPVYFDFQNSTIIFNDSSYLIKPWDSDKTVSESSFLQKSRDYSSIGKTKFPSQMVNSLYDKYNNNQYSDELHLFEKSDVRKGEVKYSSIYHFNGTDIDMRLIYKPFKVNISSIQFTRENSLLKVSVRLVYYTDSLCNNRKEADMSFYLTQLKKLPNIRYNESKWRDYSNTAYYKGEVAGFEMDDISFYTKEQSGTIWGMPELRLGLGWTTTIIFLPIIYPINIIIALNSDGERDGIRIPLFE